MTAESSPATMHPKKNTRAKLTLGFFALFSAVFFFGGAYLIYWQKTGAPTQATVTSCVHSRRTYVCRGTWMVEGKFHMGIIENANSGDRGKRIEVRARRERAIKPGLRLPIVLFGIGLGIAVLSCIWWIREAPR